MGLNNRDTHKKIQEMFTLKALVASLIGAGMLTATAAWSQEVTSTDATTTNVITVTGVRAAAESAQNIKKNSDEVMDTIVADDIGKFPDTNVAQTLAHVPGIQVFRNSYEVTSVLIDGLPDVATLLNGRDVFTSTGRYISLADIPSTMLQRVDVYKSTSADLIEGGAVGTIDVRTNRPFDFSGLKVNVKVGDNYEDKAKTNDPNGAFMVSDRWKTPWGDFGALVGLSYVDAHYHREAVWNGSPMDQNNIIMPSSEGVTDQDGNIRRTAENLAFQWKPQPGLEFYAEGMSMHYIEDNGIDFMIGFPGINQNITTNPGTNIEQSMTAQYPYFLSSMQANRLNTLTNQGAIGSKWDVTDELQLNTEISRTTSVYQYDNPILDTHAIAAAATYSPNVNESANMSFGGTNLNDPTNFYVNQLFDHYGRDQGGSTDARADLIYSPMSGGILKELSSGVRLSDHTVDSLHSIGTPEEAPANLAVTSLPGMSCTSTPLTGNVGLTPWYQPCASYLLNNEGTVRTAVTGSSAPIGWDPSTYIEDLEKTYAWYGKAKFTSKVGSVPLDAVFGVRIVRTDENLIGNSLLNGAYILTNDESSSTDVLPNMSLKFYLTNNLISRFTAGKTVGRPSFAQLNPSTSYATASLTLQATASGGNPDLKPYTSENFNDTLEWYFAKDGYLSAGVYRHNFTGYIAYDSTPETFAGNLYEVSRPFNTDSGYLQGLEFAYQQFYSALPGWGLAANATLAEGSLQSKEDPALSGQPFAGMSRYSFNVSALYELNGWSGRLAYNWRSRYTDTYDYSNSGYNLTVSPISALDGSLSYKLDKNLTASVTANNILNSNYHDSFGVFPRDSRYYDRTIGVSLSWGL